MEKPMNWTPDQLKAIDARGGTLIVSAAAGSGKTAVLVERCIRRLTDTEHPCSADRLLIVTFTRAATAEMRSRLAEAVSKKLLEDPTNEHLQKQQMLLPSAQICTIDSFCGYLVRENFEQLGLTPDFRMLDGTEVSVLQ
ncbi:MAG: UvrD-helicase domain-containing protein, partial [Clostridia bacterium]|nr:UvrD-helicase domain-containing protein [Clostridia bacterium]